MSLLFYALKVEGRTKDKPVDKFEYLAKINALELFEQKDYKTTWQIFDCEERERMDWILSPRTDLLKDRETIYLKLFDIYGPNKTISFFKLIQKDDVKEIQLKLCPNEYVLEYHDEKGMILDKSGFKVVN
ncbi:hypothetical protein [Sphingobacterium sp.]|uniref:hypothetical protein n=1 Tax=Sphingobacterium sp. TaxID=341027 RepID=UPI0028A8F008|nr:hypothetical protein [Sphingobacterium sp.]